MKQARVLTQAEIKRVLTYCNGTKHPIRNRLAVMCIDPVKSCSCYKEENVAMSGSLEDGIKRWTAKRKSALVIEILQGKTTVAAASRSYDLTPSEIESWVEDARKGMENALRANPLDVRQQYEKQLDELQAAYGEAMLELRARKKLQALMEREDDN